MTVHLSLDMEDVSQQDYRASGPGGLHRNIVDTAICLIHHPTDIIVTASNRKSQSQNKNKAWQRLEEKLTLLNYDIMQSQYTYQWSNSIAIERGNPVKFFKTE